jgi:cell division septum initiation protein DivIVA
MSKSDQDMIIDELKSIEASAELLKQRSYTLRKKLEGGKESSSSSRKGRGLSDQQREQLIANRRKRTMR